MHDITGRIRNVVPIYSVDSWIEKSNSIADHHVNGDPTSVFKSREGRRDSQTDLVRQCSVLEHILQK